MPDMMNTDRRRRRNIGACDCCRTRRTKCDGSRPKCGTCARRNVDCVYPQAPRPSQTRLEAELSTVHDRLASIEKLLLSAHKNRCCRANHEAAAIPISDWGQEQNHKVDKFGSCSVPFMVIQNPAFMDLVGLKSDLAYRMADAERAIIRTLHPNKRSLYVGNFSPTSALEAFFNKIHIWCPILSFQLREKLFNTKDLPSIPSERCLYLILLAIGSLAQYDSLPAALRDKPDTPFMEEVQLLLPRVFLENSLTALQCIIFLSTYYLCLVQPCQAHDHILMASMRAQNMLKSSTLDPASEEFVRRAFWATMLIESELAVQLDLASSGIWTFDNDPPLPSWSQFDDEASPSPFSTPGESDFKPFSNSQSPSQLLSYFLAEIAMRRMLRRCTTSTRRLPNGRQIFAPVISTELDLQLEQWHSYLPESLRFDRRYTSKRDTHPHLLFLRTQYHAYRTSILWPAVHQVLVEGEQCDEMLLSFCPEFYRSYHLFIQSAVACIPQCLPNTWTLYASVFSVTMAALWGKESLIISNVIPQEALQSFAVVGQLFEDVEEFGPSLHMMKGILAEAVADVIRGVSP